MGWHDQVLLHPSDYEEDDMANNQPCSAYTEPATGELCGVCDLPKSKHKALTTAEQHEASASRLFNMLDALLIDGMRLSREPFPELFDRRNELRHEFRELLRDAHFLGAESAMARAKKKLQEVL